MTQSFKSLFERVNQRTFRQHLREGVWYPSDPWGVVQDKRLAPALLAHAKTRFLGECVSYLIDVSNIPVYQSVLGTQRRRYFYDVYFREADVTGAGGSLQQLNLPSAEFVRAREPLLPSGSPLQQRKGRVMGPPASREVVQFLIDTVVGQIGELMTPNNLMGSFWASREFRGVHAQALAERRRPGER